MLVSSTRLDNSQVQRFKLCIATSLLTIKHFTNSFPRRLVPGALCVLSPVLCGTGSTEKRPAKPHKKGKAKQQEQIRAWLYTCAPAQKPAASRAEPGPCAPGSGIAICFWSQSQSCNSSFPAAFSQYFPAHQQRQEHLTGGGSTIWLSQPQNHTNNKPQK